MEILGVIAISIISGAGGGVIAYLITGNFIKPVESGSQPQFQSFLSKKSTKKKPIVRDDAQAWRKEHDRPMSQ